MNLNFRELLSSPKCQELYTGLLHRVAEKTNTPMHTVPPQLSADNTIVVQLSVACGLPTLTLLSLLENEYCASIIEHPSIIFSNDAIELYARFFDSLDINELPWLPVQAIGPGLVVCHFLPNAPMSEKLPSDVISRVIVGPKDYFALAEELLDRDFQEIRNTLKAEPLPQEILDTLSNLFAKSPKHLAMAFSRLFLPLTKVYKDLAVLSETAPDTILPPEELRAYLHNNFPLIIYEWCEWKYLNNFRVNNALSVLLAPDYQGLYRPVDLIDPKISTIEKLNHDTLSKIWNAGLGVLNYSERTLTLCHRIGYDDDQSTAMTDLRRVCSQFSVRYAYATDTDLTAYLNIQRDAYSALRAKTNLISATPLGGIARTNIIQLNNDELSENNIAEFVNMLLSMAIEHGASDIHIEPVADTCVIRYRLDGVLRRQIDAIPDGYLPLIINRIKNLATNMNITVTNVPQDGRARVSFAGNNIDLRIATIPVESENPGREKCVIRILDNSRAPDKIDTIFWDPLQRADIRNTIAAPYGCIIVTGPTGSGKSTTLYTLLGELNSAEKNIMTVEDPVERKLLGVQQVSVSPQVSFSTALRSFLRMDPDIILIGEIRDEETAKLTVRAAQTGHLCLTTLHTNTALGAIERLSHLGVRGHDIASSLLMVTGQRLLRTLCPACKRKVRLSAAQMDAFRRYNISSELIDDGVTYAPPLRGCRACHGTGYTNRIAITETISIDDTLREAILNEASHSKLAELSEERGLHSMFYYGLVAVSRGQTDFTELHKLLEGF